MILWCRLYYYKGEVEPIIPELQQLRDGINLDGFLNYIKKNPVSFQKYYLNNQAHTYEDILSLFQAHFSDEGSNKHEKEIDIYKHFTNFIKTWFYRDYNFLVWSNLFQTWYFYPFVQVICQHLHYFGKLMLDLKSQFTCMALVQIVVDDVIKVITWTMHT